MTHRWSQSTGSTVHIIANCSYHEIMNVLLLEHFHFYSINDYIYIYTVGAVEPEVLIRYAHMISQASSVVSPLGWQPS